MNKLVNFGAETEHYKWVLSLKNKIKNTQIKTDLQKRVQVIKINLTF